MTKTSLKQWHTMRSNKKKKDLTKMTMFRRDNYILNLTRELDKIGHIEFGLTLQAKTLDDIDRLQVYN